MTCIMTVLKMKFSDNLELVDVSPIFKKEDNFEKENY